MRFLTRLISSLAILVLAAWAQTNAAIVITPGGANFGTKLVANAKSVTVVIASDSSPAGNVRIEVRLDPPCAPSHDTAVADYTLGFTEGQQHTLTYVCRGDTVTATLTASGPGVLFDVSATVGGGTNAHETGSL